MRFAGIPFKTRQLGAYVSAALLAGASLGALAGTPYTGTAIALPSTFEAENFDKGGQNSGYYDNTPYNDGGQYRTTEAVDIALSSGASTPIINNFKTGEWLAYTVNVTAAGSYDLAIQASNNGNPSTFHFELDGVKIGANVSVASTGSWDTYAWVSAGKINLPAGQHVLKLVSDAQYFNVNSIRASLVAAAVTPPTAGTPYSGTPVALPGTIEAENFDKGGEGLGFHDLSAGNAGGQYRTSEAVDIIASTDASGGGYVVNSFQTGEWLAYTVNVAAAGKYDLAIRASNSGSDGSFHFEMDGGKIGSTITMPNTGGQNTYAWIGANGIDLQAGKHVLKLVSDGQYFNVNSLRAQASAVATAPSTPTAASTPYTGVPITLPIAFEAENFDKGGEGLGYHDLSAGNAGAVYRTAESVDLVVSSDPTGGGYVVNNFQTGEWLAYTVNVPASGNYDLSIRAANNGNAGAFHFEVDGKDVTGQVAMPNTAGWSSFAWVGKQQVPLTAGKHVLKLVSDAQYFNVNSISAMVSTTTTTPTVPTVPTVPTTPTVPTSPTASIPAGAAWSCDFESTMCGMSEHSALESSGGQRSSLVATARSASSGVRLHTEVGDNNIHGSGTWERNDIMMLPDASYCNQGQEEWWGNSVLFPSDFVFPPGPEAGIFFDFHHYYSSGQSNFEIGTIPGIGMRMRGHGGSTLNEGQYEAVIADPFGKVNDVMRNVWYDFNYHVKWSSGSDGYMIAWLNGKKVMSYSGPTLYTGISCYLKLANYHAPFGLPSSVIHDRVVRGTSAASVSLWTLE